MKLSPRLLVFWTLCLLGLGSSLYSVWHWFNLQAGLSGGAFCNLSEYWNCDRVGLSAYSSIFGIPIGAFAAIAWIGLAILAVTEKFKGKVATLITLPGAVVSLYLIYVLFFELQVGCVVCLIQDFAFVGVAVLAWNWKEIPLLRIGKAAALWAIAVALFLGLLSYKFYDLETSRETNPLHIEGVSDTEWQKFKDYYASLPVESVPLTSSFRAGDPNGKVKFVEFSDYGCPHCARAAVEIVPEIKKIPNVEVFYYPLPIDPACHPDFKGKGDPNERCEWVKASQCAFEQNKFWEVHDIAFRGLMEMRGRLPLVNDRKAQLGLDLAKFEACMKDPKTNARVQELIEVSRGLKVEGTPTYFINGKRFRGLADIRTFKAAIKLALEESGE